MFDLRARTFVVSMDTVSCHVLVSFKKANGDEHNFLLILDFIKHVSGCFTPFGHSVKQHDLLQ